MRYALLVFVSLLAACSSLPKATQQTIQSGHNQAAIAAGKAQDAGTMADAKGAASPTSHPIDASDVVVKDTRASLRVVFIVSFIALLVSIGLLFTPLSLVSKIAVPVAGALAVGSLAGEIAVPFFPYILAGLGVLALALAVYELIVAKGNVALAITDTEALIVPAKTTAAPTVAPNNHPPVK